MTSPTPSPSGRVIEALAREEGVSATVLSPPLHDVIDPDALDALCSGDAALEITFDYRGYDVTVTGGAGNDVEVRVGEASLPGTADGPSRDTSRAAAAVALPRHGPSNPQRLYGDRGK